MRLLGYAALALTLFGCAGPLHAHREFVTANAVSRAPLSLRLVNGDLRLLAPARLNDELVPWMVDTGANRHIVASTERGLERPPTTEITPGSFVITAEGSRPKYYALSALDARPQTAVFLSGTNLDDLADAGIAGILSPQSLVSRGGAVELDLPRRSFFRLDGVAERERHELAERGAAVEPATDAAGFWHPSVRAVIDARTATLLVDTGSPFTIIFADTAEGVVAAKRTGTHLGASLRLADGEPLASPVVTPASRVNVGSVSVPIASLVVARRPQGWDPYLLFLQKCTELALRNAIDVDCLKNPGAVTPTPAMTPIDGILGLDVLSSCTIMVDGTAHGAIACER